MVVLGKLLDSFQQNSNKALVFSNSIRTLDLIECFVKSKGWEFSRLDGHTSKRQAMVHAFNKSSSNLIFLVSTKAGGTGLNLTSASKVVIFDCSWNPSWDMQAQDRAYRYGQKNEVDVFRLVSPGTVEELVYMRQVTYTS